MVDGVIAARDDPGDVPVRIVRIEQAGCFDEVEERRRRELVAIEALNRCGPSAPPDSCRTIQCKWRAIISWTKSRITCAVECPVADDACANAVSW